jgi:hypothetical protein
VDTYSYNQAGASLITQTMTVDSGEIWTRSMAGGMGGLWNQWKKFAAKDTESITNFQIIDEFTLSGTINGNERLRRSENFTLSRSADLSKIRILFNVYAESGGQAKDLAEAGCGYTTSLQGDNTLIVYLYTNNAALSNIPYTAKFTILSME